MKREPTPEGEASNGKRYESVWDFPRPPALERVEWNIRVEHGGVEIANAPWAYRVLETSQPPAYYVAPEFVALEHIASSPKHSFCEWKGMASYGTVAVEDNPAPDACWTYLEPTEHFTAITGYWAFYAQALDGCFVDDERVHSNPGSFYGGWMTEQVTGPVKGAPGTLHW